MIGWAALSAMLWLTTRTVIATSTSRRWHLGNVLRLRCPGRFDAPRCLHFRVCAKETLVTLRPTSGRRRLHGWNPAPASWATSPTMKSRATSPTVKSRATSPTVKSSATSPTVKSRAISPTIGANLTPALCWKTSSPLVGSEQPRTYGRKQRLQYATASAKKYMS